MVAVNRLTGHSPDFFSVYTLPPNQATSAVAQRKINEKRSQTPPVRDGKAIVAKKSKALLQDVTPLWRAEAQALARKAVLTMGPASAMAQLPDASVQLVVMSPPFLDVVQYAGDNWLRVAQQREVLQVQVAVADPPREHELPVETQQVEERFARETRDQLAAAFGGAVVLAAGRQFGELAEVLHRELAAVVDSIEAANDEGQGSIGQLDERGRRHLGPDQRREPLRGSCRSPWQPRNRTAFDGRILPPGLWR